MRKAMIALVFITIINSCNAESSVYEVVTQIPVETSDGYYIVLKVSTDFSFDMEINEQESSVETSIHEVVIENSKGLIQSFTTSYFLRNSDDYTLDELSYISEHNQIEHDLLLKYYGEYEARYDNDILKIMSVSITIE